MLTRQLRELEADGLVLRTVYTQVPPKVEYFLTDVGSSLEPLLAQRRAWGEWYRDQFRPDVLSSADLPGVMRRRGPRSAGAQALGDPAVGDEGDPAA